MSEVGRNTVKTPENAATILEALRQGHTHKTACAFAGMSHTPFYEWIKEDDDFRRNVDEAMVSHRRVRIEAQRATKAKSKASKGDGYVYLIHCEGTNYYKIGISKIKRSTRLSVIQSSCPLKLRMIASAYCEHFSWVESTLHDIYKKHRIRGEWFEFTEEQAKRVQQEMDQYATAQIGLF